MQQPTSVYDQSKFSPSVFYQGKSSQKIKTWITVALCWQWSYSHWFCLCWFLPILTNRIKELHNINQKNFLEKSIQIRKKPAKFNKKNENIQLIRNRYAYVECESNSLAKDKAISEIYQAFVKRLSITLKTVNWFCKVIIHMKM